VTPRGSWREFLEVQQDSQSIFDLQERRAALEVFWNPSVKELVTTKFTINEVLPYLLRLAKKTSVPEALLRLELELFPLTIYEKDSYQSQIAEATKRIGDRDPKDVDVLALALTLGYPLWSNDHDFEGTGVVLFTTAILLKHHK